MIVYTAFVPHSPLLLPAIGQQHTDKVKATQQALATVAEDLKSANPEAVVIWSPHATPENHKLSLYQAPKFVGDLKEFGDLETKLECQTSVGLANRWKGRLETDADFGLVTSETLDYATALTVLLVTGNQTPILPITSGQGNAEEHYDLGSKCKSILVEWPERVAILVTGNLSHRLSRQAPAGFSLAGKTYDSLVMKFLRQGDSHAFLNMDEELISDAKECGHAGLAWLLGVLVDQPLKPRILSYSAPVGVGYLVCVFSNS